MKLLTVTAALMLIGMSACTSDTNRMLTPYRVDVPQGNYLNQEQVNLITVGMTRDQVRFNIGSPLLNSVFHGDRWDYVFYHRKSDGVTELRRLTLLFADNKVARIQADAMPDAVVPPRAQTRDALFK